MAEEKKRTKRPLTDEIATSEKDIDIYAGWLGRLENPDPVLRTEAAGKGLKLYDEVDRDAHAGCVLQTRYLAVVGREWQIVPAESAPGRGRPRAESREQKIADFVQQTLLDCNFDQARQELLQAILYGYYVWEVMWEYSRDGSDGTIGIRKLLAKHPRRFVFTTSRELRLITMANMIEGEPVPERKFISFSYGSSDNPYGKGLGQRLWWPVWFKKHGIKFWLTFAERFGQPTPVGKYPPGTPKAQQDKLLAAIDALQSETGVVIPSDMLIDLLEAARTSSISTYDGLCEYMDAQMSKTVLGQTLTTQVGDTGSYAAGKVHEGVRQDIVKADADVLCECLNETLIPWIVDYNFPDVSAYPKIWIRTEEESDLRPLAERDKILAVDIGLPVTKQYFYDTYGIPVPEEGEALVVPVPATPALAAAMFAEKKTAVKYPAGQQAIEELADEAALEALGKVDPLLKPLLDLIRNGESWGDIMGRIYDLYPGMDSAQLEDLTEQAMFMAQLWGYVKK